MLGLLSKLVKPPSRTDLSASAGSEAEDFYFEDLLSLLAHDCSRVVFYQEHAGQGSTLLFDSYATKLPNRAERSTKEDKEKGKDAASKVTDSAPSPLRKLPPSLGEMMFGTMPMSLEGRSSKMHFLTSLNLVLISRLATVRIRTGQSTRKVTFAIGALFDIRLRDFLLWHFGSGVEREVDRLLRHFLRTVLSPECPASLQTEPHLLAAVEHFQTSFNRLISAPRLDRVMWVQLFAEAELNERREAASDFLRTLEAMRFRWDGPRSNYFLSTLITSLLATDLSWTHSLRSHFSSTSFHPSHRIPSSRTILTGLGPSHLRPLLSLLSYFVRPHGPLLPKVQPLCGLLTAHEASDHHASESQDGEAPSELRERRESIGTLEEALVAQLNMLSLCSEGTEQSPEGFNMDKILASRCALAQSLFASYLPYYSDHFVLMGLGKMDSEAELAQRLHQDVKARSAQGSHAYCLVADVASFRCQVYCSGGAHAAQCDSGTRHGVGGTVATLNGRSACSDFVRESLASTEGLWKAGLPPEGCVQYLEDRLLQLIELSRLLADFLASLPTPPPGQPRPTLADAAARLGLGFADANLLLPVALATGPASLHTVFPLSADGLTLPIASLYPIKAQS